MIRLLHILSSALMLGVGVGAFWFVQRAAATRDPGVMREATHSAVAAELAFGIPVAIVQPLTGWLLMEQLGYSFSSVWFWSVVAAYIVTGMCWVYLVKAEFRLRALTAGRAAGGEVAGLDAEFAAARRLAVATLAGVVLLFALMVFRPGL
ncbi:MAG: DUF2269 family protein [Gammaproteobacteria bacterium]|nr:DUF2269 family protein [Gammaproteobacteria bacterium]